MTLKEDILKNSGMLTEAFVASKKKVEQPDKTEYEIGDYVMTARIKRKGPGMVEPMPGKIIDKKKSSFGDGYSYVILKGNGNKLTAFIVGKKLSAEEIDKAKEDYPILK